MYTGTTRDTAYILDILGYCERCNQILERLHRNYEEFSKDLDLQDALALNLSLIGETVNNLSLEFKDKTSDKAPWHQMVATRNIIVHDYANVRWQTIWETVTENIPNLQKFCQEELGVDSTNEYLKNHGIAE
jgi:uncharacterized protein with HEPN domain